jgi:ArsR family transcriptional regulator
MTLAKRSLAEALGTAILPAAVADPYRPIILATLASVGGEACVCDFTNALPLNQPTVSHHLRTLREAQLVTCERRGTWVYYSLALDAKERLVFQQRPRRAR